MPQNILLLALVKHHLVKIDKGVVSALFALDIRENDYIESFKEVKEKATL